MQPRFTDQKQLRELESRCIQEHAPFCAAACPIHIDVRGMLAEAGKGDFAAGLKILRKTLPFPGIISRICDQPCQAVCKRGEVGDPLDVAAVERACVELGGPGEKVSALPRKPRTVAVIGGGLSGLTAAFDLARKGYEVFIYEATGRLGGRIWDYTPGRLPVEVIEKDLEVIERLGIEVLLNTPVGKVGSNGHLPLLSRLCEEFEAIYLGIGPSGSETYHLNLDRDGRLLVDPQTLQTSQGGVFAGGGFLQVAAGQPPALAAGARQSTRQEGSPLEALEAPRYSPIASILDGRRAATSIDRCLQRVSLTAARANEGAYTTRLYTGVAGFQPLPKVAPASPPGGYTAEEAVQEARRCLQCECMECVKNCEYLKHYGGYPKKYLREIYNNLSIVMGTRHANKMVNSCSLCGLCGEVCPEDLDMGAVCKEARQIMVEQKRMPPSAHDFALRDMAFSNGPQFALARSQPGKAASALAFFPGCQLSASSPEYVQGIYEHLRAIYSDRLPEGSGVGLALRCCGAPADWAGRQDLFAASQAEFLAEHERLGRPKLILACSSCYQVFKTHYPSIEIVSLWEILAAEGLPAGQAQTPAPAAPLAVHDPCSTRYEAGIQDSVRQILDRLGVAVEELPLSRERTECCSYGGSMWLANRELAEQVVRRRIEASPAGFVTYCAMCRDFFARQGKPALHLLDLVFGEDLQSRSTRQPPGYSERHENRRRLKLRLLREIWGAEHDMEESPSYQSIQLVFSETVQQRLEDRLILVEDIQQVIEHAERTGQKLLNQKTGHFLAYYKPASVTYWVEYTLSEEAGEPVYQVHNAYSHRMVIGGESEK